MTWSLACPDWAQRLAEGRSLVPELPLNQALADKAVEVFGALRLPDVPGNPLLADAAGPWFLDIVRAAFGSWFPETGERYIREVFALVAKKNSKTTYSAALALTWLLLNERPRAKGILVAPTQDITEVAYSAAEGMVLLDPGLNRKRLKVQNHVRRITNLKTAATLEILTFDPSILTGQKPAFWLLDELHEIAKRSKASSAFGQLRGGMISQPEAFGVMISTQSEEQPAGIFKEELVKARRVRDGVDSTSRVLPILYEFPEAIAGNKDRWRDPKNWPMVVPNNGRSIVIERLVEGFVDAEKTSPEKLKQWASQHLNVEIGVGIKTDHWPGARYWERQGDKELTLKALIERSDVIAVGGDGGGLDDLLGLAVLGRDRDSGRWLHWGKAWAHRNVLDLRKEIAPRLLDFEAAGELAIVDKMSDAFIEFADIIEEVRDSGSLAKVGLDPYGVSLIIDELAKRDITVENSDIIGVSQGYKLMGVIKSTEDKLSDGEMVHCGQTLMAWSVGNARIEQRGNAILVTKQASGVAKIDPVMAMFCAAAIMLDPKYVTEPSIYNSEAARPAGFLIV